MGHARRAAAALVVVLVAGVLSACESERTYTYRIAVRGPVTASVDHFSRHVASTLSDPRGWSLAGAVQYRQVQGPADFTVWLATADQVPSFSSYCSRAWSCRVGPNVIINEDRWRHATPRWPYGVDAYRHYVVNHEVGHWLGMGHSNCTAPAGHRAPVMAQQSKGGAAVGACRFNVWPTEAERRAVARLRGVTARPVTIPTPDDPFGRIDRVEVERDERGRPDEVRLVGWALDGDTSAPLQVVVNVDGRQARVARADRTRPDVQRTYPYWGDRRGFDVTVDVPADAEVVCVDVLGVGAGKWSGSAGCRVVK